MVARYLKVKEHLLHPYQKKFAEKNQEDQIHAKLSLLQSNYVKLMVQFKVKSELLTCTLPEVQERTKNHGINEIFMNYEFFNDMIQMSSQLLE